MSVDVGERGTLSFYLGQRSVVVSEVFVVPQSPVPQNSVRDRFVRVVGASR